MCVENLISEPYSATWGCIRVWLRRRTKALSREGIGFAELVPEEFVMAVLATGYVNKEGPLLEPFGAEARWESLLEWCRQLREHLRYRGPKLYRRFNCFVEATGQGASVHLRQLRVGPHADHGYCGGHLWVNTSPCRALGLIP